MKRSEALALINRTYVDWVKEVSGTDLSNLENFVAFNERLLSELEKAGMLPPRIDFMIGHMRASDNAWEPEDG